MEKENEKDLYRRAVIGTKERVEKELPIMRQNLDTLKENEENYTVLAQTVHNIAIIINNEAYRFFEPFLRLWESNEVRKRSWMRIGKATIVEKDTDVVRDVLTQLINQEKKLHNRQLEEAKKERKKMLVEKKDEPVPTLEEMIADFRHVEYDPSAIFERFWMHVLTNNIELNDKHLGCLREIRSTCVSILEEYIPKREESIKKCDYILQKIDEAAAKAEEKKEESK